MKTALKKGAALIAAVLVLAVLMAGCGAQTGSTAGTSASGTQGGTQQLASDPAALNELMGKLASAATLEEANELIGSEGVKGEERTYDGGSLVTVTTPYEWEIGDDKSIDGTYKVYEKGTGEDSATYETNYNYKRVKDYADFSNWDEIEKKLKSSEGLTYDEMVEMLGGVQGLRTKVSTTGEVTYHWYDATGGYLFTNVDADGKCGSTSGWF